MARLLVLTQLLFNIGFFVVVPYLAGHLAGDLGLAGWIVGLALGLRSFSQQGMFVVGWVLTDRFGAKPLILAGCVVRVAGFVALAVADTLPGILCGVILVGLAGALFTPAVETSLALEAPVRSDAFAVFRAYGEIGTVVGPLLGIVVSSDFRVACVIGAVIFGATAVVHVKALPHRPGEHQHEPVFAGWREVFGNRVFLLFAAGYSAALVSYNQLYLALPDELRRLEAPESELGLLFAMASGIVVFGQLPVTAARRYLGGGKALVLGFGLMTLAFVVVALRPPGLTGPAAFVFMLTIGQMLVVPFAKEITPLLARERRLGAHFELLASLGGVAVLFASTASGALLEHGRIAWLLLGLFPLAGACVMAWTARRGAFD